MKFTLRMLNPTAQLGVLTTGEDTFRDVVERQLDARAQLADVWSKYGIVEPTFYGPGHHWMSYPQQFSDPFVLLGYVAARWPEAHLNSGFLQMPLWSALDFAEQVASVVAFTDHGLVTVVGLGWRQEEFLAAGTDVKYRVSRFEESVAACRALWAGEELDHEGKHWTIKGRLGRPLQNPDDVTLVAGVQSPPAAARAGRIADGLHVSWTMNHESYDRINTAFQDAVEEHARPAPRYWAMAKFISVDPVEERAFGRLDRMAHMFDWYQGTDKWTSSDVKTAIAPEDEALERTVTGTPASVVDQLEIHARKFPYTDPILTWLAPGNDPDENLEHFEMLCESVVVPLAERFGIPAGQAVLRV
jgi:alkanesulfonate monooxygenase SsuD/methylene tetrahydromethanopterin reductase-like flavin-dependent oxidoreductase (luciferase family)